MTEEFRPIHSQAMFDERIRSRLAREREKWEKDKEGAVADLRAQIEEKDKQLAEYEEKLAQAEEDAEKKAEAVRAEKDKELAEVRSEWSTEKKREAVESALRAQGHTEGGRVSRIMRQLDLDAIETDENGNPLEAAVHHRLYEIEKDIPELFAAGNSFKSGAGSGGSAKPVLEQEKPLTREEIEAMSPEEQRRPGVKERIDRFLAGQR